MYHIDRYYLSLWVYLFTFDLQVFFTSRAVLTYYMQIFHLVPNKIWFMDGYIVKIPPGNLTQFWNENAYIQEHAVSVAINELCDNLYIVIIVIWILDQ